MQIFSKPDTFTSSFTRDVTDMKGDVVMMDLALQMKGNKDITCGLGDRKHLTKNVSNNR